MDIKRPVSDQPLPENAQRVFQGIVFDVYQWEVTGYDGSTKIFEKLKRPDTAAVIPVTEDKKILVALQEQPGKEPYTDLISGRSDEGENPLEAAQRELLEETGYESKNWLFFSAHQPVTKIDWCVFIFVARDCRKVAKQNLDGAEKITPKLMEFEEFFRAVLSGKIENQELRTKFLEMKIDPQKMEEMRRFILG